MSNIAVVGGAGYVGLAYSAALAELGHTVTALDLDEGKIHELSQGRTTIFEPGLEELLKRGLESRRLRFTTQYSEALSDAAFAFICVGTPPSASGRADTTYVKEAARSIARHARGQVTVVNKSTMPLGSVHLVERILQENVVGDTVFSVVSNPEFLREGSAVYDIFNPDRIVLGTDDPEAAQRVADLYESLSATVLITTPHSAEMIKYAANAFLATKISFINEIALICEPMGADVDVVAKAMGMDGRIGPRFLRAGAGFGGSCFPKDVQALAQMARDSNVDPQILEAVLDVNAEMRRHIVRKLEVGLGGDLAGKTIAVLGLAFKPNTDDVRESPAMEIIERLLERGAVVRAADPEAAAHAHTLMPDVYIADSAYDAVTGADAVVLMTEWNEYRNLDLFEAAARMRGRFVLDGRGMWDPAAISAAGLIYEGVGRREQPAAVVTPALEMGATRPIMMIAGGEGE